MPSSAEDTASRAKLAKLAAALRHDLGSEFIEEILRTEPGDVNYAIPYSDRLESINLEPGTILHQRDIRCDIAKIFELLLRHGADVTRKNSQGQTAVHAEFSYLFDGDSENWNRRLFDSPTLRALLSAHVDYSILENLSDDNGVTHLHAACVCGHARAVEFFLDNGVDIDQSIKQTSPIFPGCSPLHMSVRGGRLEIAKKLLEHGANVRSKDAEGSTPLRALVKRNLAIMNWEVNGLYGKLIEEYSTNQLMIRLLLTSSDANNNNNNNNNSSKCSEHGFTDFHATCVCDDLSIVEDMLAHLDDVDRSVDADSPLWPGYTPLHFAAHCNADVVELLLARGSNLLAEDVNGITPLEICSQRYPVEVLLRIMSSQKDTVLSDNSTRLFDVLQAMESEAAYRSLIDRIGDVNCRVNEDSALWPGCTLLHFAVLFFDRVEARNYADMRSSDEGGDVRKDEGPSLAMIEELIANGADFTLQNSRGRTPLHLAFYSQKKDILSVFLDNGHGATNPIDDNDLSHLHIACANGVYGTIRNLVLGGANVNLLTRLPVKLVEKDSSRMAIVRHLATGSTPLHTTLLDDKNVEVAKFLMRQGANPNATNAKGWSPLHCVMLLNHPEEMGKALFAFTARLREKVVEGVGLSHLHVACHVDSLKGAKKLIALGSDVDAIVDFKASPLTKDLRLLEETNCASFTPLHFAVLKDSLKMVKLLLDAGADILAKNTVGKSPLDEILATKESKSKLVDLLVARLRNSKNLRRRMEEDSGILLLHILAFKMDVEGVEELLNEGVNVNVKVKDDSETWPGCTALHAWVHGALKSGCALKREKAKNTLKLLLSSGADVTLADAKMDTPLQAFFRFSGTIDEKIILTIGRSLLNSQKDFGVNPTNAHGLSHFHISVRMCEMKIVEEFLKRGVDVNQRVDYFADNHEGCTALHLVTSARSRYTSARMQTINLLLRYGADVRTQDYLGDTPLHVLADNKFRTKKVVEKIVEAGGMHHVANIFGQTPFAVLLKSSQVSAKEVEYFMLLGCRFNAYNAIDQTGLLALLFDNYDVPKDEICKMFLESPHAMNIDSAGRTVLHNIVSYYARGSEEKYMEVIKQLSDYGMNIDAQDYAGKTALHTAAKFKNKPAITSLLSNGADINIVDETNKSAFDYALEMSDDFYEIDSVISAFWENVRLMQLTGIDVSVRNENLMKELPERYVSYASAYFQKNLNYLKSTKQINVVNSLKLYDFLSEMGAVAAYSTMFHATRQAIDKFFTTDNEVLDKDCPVAVRRLLKLQYRKAVKRAALIRSACDSLRMLSGIALPELCCENLMKYFSLSDVERLIASTKN